MNECKPRSIANEVAASQAEGTVDINRSLLSVLWALVSVLW